MRIKNGYVVNDANIQKVQDIYLKPLAYISTQLKNSLWKKIMSFYVRWGVAAGTSTPFFSDMDIVCILHWTPTKKELVWARRICILIEKKYPFIKDMDLTLISYHDITVWAAWNNLRNNLVTQSICLFGEDITPSLPKKPVGKELCRYLYGGLDEHLKKMMMYITHKEKKFFYISRRRNLRFVCRRIMRTILRSAWWIVMLSKPFYSPDVKLCCKEFVKLYPEYASPMDHILTWEYFPINNRKKIMEFLNQFLPKYLIFFKQKISW